jgi:hypothetical protein
MHERKMVVSRTEMSSFQGNLLVFLLSINVHHNNTNREGRMDSIIALRTGFRLLNEFSSKA